MNSAKSSEVEIGQVRTEGIASEREAVAALEAAYGPPSQAAFGSAVFHAPLDPAMDLEQAALAHYQHFVGELWQRFGGSAWRGAWREVYRRPADKPADIVSELQTIDDPEAASAVDMILNGVDDPDAARSALAAVFDDLGMREVGVFAIGDGAAMSGVLVAGRRDDEEISVVFLMD